MLVAKRILIALTILVLASMACGLSGSSTEAPTSPPIGITADTPTTATTPAAQSTSAPVEDTARGAGDDPTPSPMPIFPDYVETATVYDMAGNEHVVAVPARTLVQVLSAHVEAGELSPEAAAITGLQLLLGDVTVETVFPNSAVSLDAGFMMMNYAATIFNESSDKTAGAEIEGLFTRLIPTQAMLDQISRPADSSGLRPVGGMAMTDPNQTSECTTIWDSGFDQGAGPDCLLYNEFSAEGHSYRVYFPAERMSDGAFVPYAEAAFESLQQSQEIYTEFAPMRSINLIFVDRELTTERDPSLMALASLPGIYLSDLGGEPCPIMVHPQGLTIPLDEFRQTIAHEIFHCVQLWVKGAFGGDSAVWYIEGNAEFIITLITPEGDAVNQTISQNPTGMGPLGGGTPLTYVCTDTELTFTLPPGLVPWSQEVWIRLSEPVT